MSESSLTPNLGDQSPDEGWKGWANILRYINILFEGHMRLMKGEGALTCLRYTGRSLFDDPFFSGSPPPFSLSVSSCTPYFPYLKKKHFQAYFPQIFGQILTPKTLIWQKYFPKTQVYQKNPVMMYLILSFVDL